jgi:glycosyltransferase involved in cell wall biosynthesis
MKMNKIILVMIVKDEGHIIARCLDSVKGIIDGVVICDTGSRDDTVTSIASWSQANDIVVHLSCEKWVDFSTNRNITLNLARSIYQDDNTWFLMIDADEVINYGDEFDVNEFKKSLVGDTHSIIVRMGGLTYMLPKLIKSTSNAYFNGVLHEYLVNPNEPQFNYPPSEDPKCFIWNTPIQDSARNNLPDKYARDAVVLQLAYDSEEDPFLKSRYCFYLAQSYRDAGNYEKAIFYYKERANKFEFWSEERYCSLLYVGRMQIRTGVHYKEAIKTFQDAIVFSPSRHEAPLELVALCRDKIVRLHSDVEVYEEYEQLIMTVKSALEHPAFEQRAIQNQHPELHLFYETPVLIDGQYVEVVNTYIQLRGTAAMLKSSKHIV